MNPSHSSNRSRESKHEPTRLGDYFKQSVQKGRKGLPLLSITIASGMVDRESLDRKMDSELAEGEYLLVRPGDIAYNMMRMWQGALAVADREGLVSPAYVVVRPIKAIAPHFAGFFLKSPRMLHQLWAYSYGLTDDRLRLYYKDFAMIRAEFPPLPEQRRVAEILSTWDAAIEQTEKLIDAKQGRKRALMAKLLTGKRRFREFGGKPWKQVHLHEVSRVSFSGVDKKSEPGEQPVRLCNYMDVYRNATITNRIDFMNATATALEVERFSLQVGDVMITKDSETPDDIGVAAVVAEPLAGVLCGYHLALLRPEAAILDSGFLANLFGEPGIQYKLSTLANGATRYGLTNAAISNLRIPLPSLPEQQKIAAVLNAAEAEQVQLKDQLAALRRQKQGLMQVLLTGKVRAELAN